MTDNKTHDGRDDENNSDTNHAWLTLGAAMLSGYWTLPIAMPPQVTWKRQMGSDEPIFVAMFGSKAFLAKRSLRDVNEELLRLVENSGREDL